MDLVTGTPIDEKDPTAQCECGSGDTFADCCRLAFEMFDGRRDVGTLFDGPQMRSFTLGDVVYRIVDDLPYARPAAESCHEFLNTYLLTVLGVRWQEQQKLLPSEERHIITKWRYANYEFMQEVTAAPLPRNACVPFCGASLELFSLAADVLVMQLKGGLPKRLLARLRSRDGFQGARYELAVAAALTRVGFELAWQYERSTKHCEFLATHGVTGETVAIEAKSRRRPGTLNEPGERPSFDEIKADIWRLYNSATKQRPPGLPYIIFIEVNVPNVDGLAVLAQPWVQDMMRKMANEGDTMFAQSPPNLLVVTNSGWHYDNLTQSDQGKYMVARVGTPTVPFKDPRSLAAILRGVSKFCEVPSQL